MLGKPELTITNRNLSYPKTIDAYQSITSTNFTTIVSIYSNAYNSSNHNEISNLLRYGNMREGDYYWIASRTSR